MNAVTSQESAAMRVIFFFTLAPLLVVGQATNTPSHRALSQPLESVRVPLIRANSEEFPGDAAAKDFFVQLPEHVSFQAGCELRLALYPSREVLSRLCTIKASINGQSLSGAVVEGKSLNSINDRAIRLRFPLPEG